MERIELRTSDGLRLEGELRVPDGTVRAPAVICHPHPQQGGSKDHPLLWAIRNELASRGFAVVSFNFRGVMGSEGSFGGGEAEVADVRAALDRASQEGPGAAFVAGWSFGAHVALRTGLSDERVGALALVGMPLGESSLVLPPLPSREELRAFGRPVLLVSGAADHFSPAPEVRGLARRLGDARVEIVENADHFFWKRERDVAQIVGGFATEALPGQD